jgi:hypothetical protein
MTLVKWIEVPNIAEDKWWYIGLYVGHSYSEMARIGPRYVTSYTRMTDATFVWGGEQLPTQLRKTIIRKIYKVFLLVLLKYAGVRGEERMPHVRLGAQEDALRDMLTEAVEAFGIMWHRLYQRTLVFTTGHETTVA